MIDVIAARGENLERNPLPPTVKAVQVIALTRTKISPNVEPKRKIERENTPFEMTRRTPKNPTSIPIIPRAVILSPRKRRAAIVMKIGIMATIHPV
jgi:hypothetical protein